MKQKGEVELVGGNGVVMESERSKRETKAGSIRRSDRDDNGGLKRR